MQSGLIKFIRDNDVRSIVEPIKEANRFNLVEIMREEIKELHAELECAKGYSNYRIIRTQRVQKLLEDLLGEIADVFVVLAQLPSYVSMRVELDINFNIDEKAFIWKMTEEYGDYILATIKYKVQRTLVRNRVGYYNDFEV